MSKGKAAGFSQRADHMIWRPNTPALEVPMWPQCAMLGGIVRGEVWRALRGTAKSGVRQLTEVLHGRNMIVDEGLSMVLDSWFSDAETSPTDWFCGLVDNTGFTAVAEGDTHEVHGGWSESSAYDEASRPEWLSASESSSGSPPSVANATQMTFTIDTNSTAIWGIFISDVSTKPSTGTGTLWTTAGFSSVANLDDNDQLKITYTLTATYPGHS